MNHLSRTTTELFEVVGKPNPTYTFNKELLKSARGGCVLQVKSDGA